MSGVCIGTNNLIVKEAITSLLSLVWRSEPVMNEKRGTALTGDIFPASETETKKTKQNKTRNA